jgi:5-methylcytosine-specific restriction endonuclease McrA
MDSSADFPQKQCTDCLHFFPATLDHFHAYKRSKDGLRNLCKECRSKRDKQNREKNHEHYLQYEQEYRDTHHEQVQARDRKYRQTEKGRKNQVQRQRRYNNAHPGISKQISSRYYWTHHDQCIQSLAEYRITHREKMRELAKAYYRKHPEKASTYLRNHPEKRRVYQATRRARQISVGGSFTAYDIEKQHRAQKGKCYWCHKQLTRYHVDHIVPLSRNGSNNPDNLVVACSTCNTSRGKKLPHEWPQGGRLL